MMVINNLFDWFLYLIYLLSIYDYVEMTPNKLHYQSYGFFFYQMNKKYHPEDPEIFACMNCYE